MTTATASLPRTAGNGAALVVVAAEFIIGLLEKMRSPEAAPRVEASAAASAAENAGTLNVWKLYHAGAGSDSINPKTAAMLQDILAAS